MESEKEQILFGLKHWGKRAYEELRSSGIPVVVLRGNNVCCINSVGKAEVITKVSQSKYRIRQRFFELPK